MVEVREIGEGSTGQAAEAMLALRAHHGTPAAIVAAMDAQRADGYRVVGAFVHGVAHAVAVAGFRPATSLSWGRHLYVDDVSTLPEHRGNGYADRLLTWLLDEGRRLGCSQLHLDSGVGPERAAAHRLYLRHHLMISAHHFHSTL